MYVDVCEAVAAKLKETGYAGVLLKRMDEMTGREGIVVRLAGSRVVNAHFDRTYTVRVIVNVMCCYYAEAEAMTSANDIRDTVDGAALPSINGSYRWTATEVYTEPQEITLDEAGRYVWNVQFAVTIERG